MAQEVGQAKTRLNKQPEVYAAALIAASKVVAARIMSDKYPPQSMQREELAKEIAYLADEIARHVGDGPDE